jgi:predicted nucleic acid-binding protein
MLLLDTDIASAFAKAGYVDELADVFKNKIAISKQVFDELMVPVSYGYNFPYNIINKVSVVLLKEEEFNFYESIMKKYPSLGKGELESIVIAKQRGWNFTSFDRIALNCADKEEIKVIFPLSLFKFLSEEIGMDKTMEIIKGIEKEDKRGLEDLKSRLMT